MSATNYSQHQHNIHASSREFKRIRFADAVRGAGDHCSTFESMLWASNPLIDRSHIGADA